MSSFPPCPKCHSPFTYEDLDLLVCPQCAHEWRQATDQSHTDEPAKVKDANGNNLFEGDNATLIKDLKVKGSSNVLKIGTKIRITRIVDGDHNIDCRVDKVGEMMLKSEFVKKATA
ncbi:zinc ribbon domain-containing protein YjdM [Haliea sp. E1-2-M8]|uniref:zinc ribbon domain-containing protein YjdM n=1 Tax=Haliea sp. E1-2-M8 TaxID=3064706 RepID=UPI002720878D|nr:zinc ribbon domain-containing protein YjdM [Haliea sp. E1-2-M8]MDO8864078.1 zinc ribbon domain-containing protein YjdM [Haliea sp. E1-2-M8]